jgi:acetyl-CoA acetyltransferase family protein
VAVPSALVVDAVRTPFGSHDSKMAGFHAVDLLAAAFTGALEHSGLDIGAVDHVIAGCAVPVGEQAINIARSAALAAGWSESIPAHTVDAQGASGILAFHEAVARVGSGMSRVCLVGAVASTRVPDGASTGVAVGKPFGTTVHDRFAEEGGLRSPGVTAEHLAMRMQIDRATLDAYAQTSLQRAQSATENGAKKPYLLEIRDQKKIPTIISQDEKRPKRDIGKLKPLFEKDGALTAATFALPVSGAVAIVVAHPDAVPRHTKPLAEVISCVSAGADVLHGSSGADVAKRAVKGTSKKSPRIEVHEDSAVAPVAFAKDFGCALDTVNVDGGSLATGDAFGVSALASLVNLVHQLDARNPWGLAVSAGANAISTATMVKVHTP